ncbi:hypothetical protein [Verrucosispora sp. TAA-831]|uniref:hypothetical protein n=1 Tax=Verrucosispora sp. TAA-831 TaxID=3422227 RepID=UPI003D6FFAE9
MNILDTINRAIDGRCPCGEQPRLGSAYCGDDCKPTHVGDDTDTRSSGRLATPARWRPGLTITDDAEFGYEPIAADTHYEGRYFARLLRPRDTDALHLRLDDGHRWVGHTIDGFDGSFPPPMVARIKRGWRRLERQFGDSEQAVIEAPPPDLRPDLLREVPAEVQLEWQWWCDTCRQPLPTARWHGDIPYHLLDDYMDFHRIIRRDADGVVRGLDDVIRRALGMISQRTDAARAALGIPAWQRRCRTCGEYGEPRYGARPVGGPQPIGGGAMVMALEPCQECRHCGSRYPGPLLAVSTEYRPDRAEWHYAMRARVGGSQHGYRAVVRDEELEEHPNPVAYLRRQWDRMEARLLRAIADHEDGPSSDELDRQQAAVDAGGAVLHVGPPAADPNDQAAWREVGTVDSDGLTYDVSASQWTPDTPNVDREQAQHTVNAAIRAGDRIMNSIAARLAPVMAAMRDVARRLPPVHAREQPPADPMQRALWLRRHRNTGPAPDRLDGRRNRRNGGH